MCFRPHLFTCGVLPFFSCRIRSWLCTLIVLLYLTNPWMLLKPTDFIQFLLIDLYCYLSVSSCSSTPWKEEYGTILRPPNNDPLIPGNFLKLTSVSFYTKRTIFSVRLSAHLLPSRSPFWSPFLWPVLLLVPSPFDTRLVRKLRSILGVELSIYTLIYVRQVDNQQKL